MRSKAPPFSHAVEALPAPPDDALAVEMRGVRKVFRQGRREEVALKGIDLTLERGEVVAILGPNGSGKSTLIRILSTLLLPDRGSAYVFGLDAARKPLEVRRHINRVSAEPSFFKKLSVVENLRFAAGAYGMSSGEARVRTRRVTEAIGFPRSRLDTPLEALSRGQQQKVAIARALLTTPVLLLLDEPTTGLDPRARRDVQLFLGELIAERRTAVLLCTHDMQEAERLSDRLVIMESGRFVAAGTAETLRQETQSASLEEVFFRVTGLDYSQADSERETVGEGGSL